jgi:hypothetical protein
LLTLKIVVGVFVKERFWGYINGVVTAGVVFVVRI